jgi:diaminohydroxyphosphoribosylaminopyrimidine deaminase / 5-amino-6-(5-phosphoribosylamino)uracil reductase
MHREHDTRHMRRALELARAGIGRVSPNPLVGCVLVDREGKVIGEGTHQEFGGPHAEVLAIRNVESRGYSVTGATMYVTLEPHSFHGKTPPCSALIIEKKIARCVIAIEDPNPRVAGDGIRQLREGGIEVEVGVCEEEAREQNRFFIKHVTTGVPYVTLKLAISADGRSAPARAEQKWITSEASRRRVHAMRAEHDAVMVGTRTAIIDDPQLTVRFDDVHRQPWRVVLDARNELPETLKLFSDEQKDRTLRITARRAPSSAPDSNNIEVAAQSDKLDLQETYKALGARGIASVLVEAGPTLAASIVEQRLFDELVVFQAPIVLGEDARAAMGDITLEDLGRADWLTLRSTEAVEDSGDVEIRFRRLD